VIEFKRGVYEAALNELSHILFRGHGNQFSNQPNPAPEKKIAGTTQTPP
jgi:hypothetical protein